MDVLWLLFYLLHKKNLFLKGRNIAIYRRKV